MKKSLVTLVVVLIASINISAFEINTDDSVMNQLANDATSSSTSVFLEAVTEETGYVESMFGVHIANGDSENPILLGEETVGMMTKENRPIFTFDTSGIPATANINYVLLWVGVDVGESSYSYLFENVAVDFAGPVGFGGSFTMTSMDYYSYGMGSFDTVIGNAAVGGLMLNLDINQNLRNLNPYINRLGKTQIRLRFKNNPDNVLMKLYGASLPYPVEQKAILYVGWE